LKGFCLGQEILKLWNLSQDKQIGHLFCLRIFPN